METSGEDELNKRKKKIERFFPPHDVKFAKVYNKCEEILESQKYVALYPTIRNALALDEGTEFYKKVGYKLANTGKYVIVNDKLPAKEWELTHDLNFALTKNVKTTNKIAWISAATTFLFGIIVTSIQVKSCIQGKSEGRQLINTINIDSIKRIEQKFHDTIIVLKVLHQEETKDTSKVNAR